MKGRIMSILAKRLSRISPSPTVAITAKANELKAAGHDVIGLGAGEPDFDTPDHIKQACIDAINANKTRYVAPAGIVELRQAICDKLKRDNGLDYNINQIHVGCGGKQTIFNAMLATVESGDEIIIPAPYWVSYPDICALNEGKPVFVECIEENDFKITPEQLRNAISKKTKWLILNSPSNPTGSGYSKQELQALADILLEPENSHVWVMCDDMYEFIVYDDFEFSTMAAVEPKLFDRILTLNGLSKAYCMTGWRLGYAAGSEEIIKKMNMLQSQSATSATTFVQWAGVEALNGDHSFIKKHNDAFKVRRDLVVGLINDISGLSCRTPQGAFYVYPSCAGIIGKTTPDGKIIRTDGDFITYLLESKGVAAVQGEAFGLSPYFRISYATSNDALVEACKRIAAAVAELT